MSGAGVQPLLLPIQKRPVWGRREGCREISWAGGDDNQNPPNLHVFALSLPGAFVIITEASPTHLQRKQRYNAVWGARGCGPNPGHRAPAACKQPEEPSAPCLAELPDQAVGSFPVCWGEKQRDSCHWEQSITSDVLAGRWTGFCCVVWLATPPF